MIGTEKKRIEYLDGRTDSKDRMIEKVNNVDGTFSLTVPLMPAEIS